MKKDNKITEEVIKRRKENKHKLSKNEMQIKKICDNFYNLKNKNKYFVKFESYISWCKKKMRKEKLSNEELDLITTIAKSTEKYDYTVFAIKTLVLHGETIAAINLLTSQLSNESYTNIQREKLNKLNIKIKEIENTIKSKNDEKEL